MSKEIEDLLKDLIDEALRKREDPMPSADDLLEQVKRELPLGGSLDPSRESVQRIRDYYEESQRQADTTRLDSP